MISAHYYWPEKQKKSLKLISLYYSNESFFCVFLHLAFYHKNHHTQILYITVYNWMKNKHCYPGEKNRKTCITYTGICTSSVAKVFTCLQHQNWRGEEQIVTLCYMYQRLYIYMYMTLLYKSGLRKLSIYWQTTILFFLQWEITWTLSKWSL